MAPRPCASAPGVSARGRLCCGWLGVSPSLLFQKAQPRGPCCTDPGCNGMHASAPGFVFGVQHGGQRQHLQKCRLASLSKAKSLRSCHISLEKVGQASLAAVLEISPLPTSRPGEGSFGSISAQRRLRGTSPLGQCRCQGLRWVQLVSAHLADPRFPILAEVYLAVFWSEETLSPCFPPPTPSKTLQIRLKRLPFLSTPFV